MQEMILLNPGKKKRRVTKRKTAKTAAKRKVKRRAKPAAKRTTRKTTARSAAPKRKRLSTMAKKRKSYKRKTTARRNPAPRRRRRAAPRRNPSRARRAYSRARSTFAGLNIKQALKDQIPMIVGMMGAKWAAKRFGTDASETDPESWNYMSYIKAGLGAVGTAFLAQNLKAGSGQKVLTGGLAYVGFKLVQNELITKSEWATEQFGAEDYYPSEYLEGADYQPGSIEYNSAGQPYLLGDDLEWRELPADMAGQAALAPVGRLGAEYSAPLQPVDALGADPGSDAAYRDALLS